MPWDTCCYACGPHAINKPALQLSSAPLMYSPALWRQPQTVDCLRFRIGCQEPNVDSFSEWLAPKSLPGDPELAYETVRLSAYKSRIQREFPAGTKLCQDKLHFIFWGIIFSFLLLCYYFCFFFLPYLLFFHFLFLLYFCHYFTFFLY